MSTLKLTKAQREALEQLAQCRLDGPSTLMLWGASRNRTARALIDKGYARYFASSEKLGITSAGREVLRGSK